MSKLLSKGVIAGVCGAVSAIATVYGAHAIADFFAAPALPGQILIVLGTVVPVVAGFLPNHAKPAAPAAPAA